MAIDVDAVEGIIAGIYFAIDSLYMKLFAMVWEHWEYSVGAFNHGQTSIYEMYLYSEIEGWLDDAQSAWPYADADYYVDWLMSAYDGEVMERAFSDVIYDPVDHMWDIIYQAQELQETAEMLEAMLWFA